MAMTTIMEHADDQHVRAYVVYGKTADHKLYYDAKYTTQVAQADAENAFKKGMLHIIDTTTTLIPVAMTGTTVKTVGKTSVTATSGSVEVAALVDWAVKADT